MDRNTFLALLYLLGIAPFLYALSLSVDATNPFVIFGLFNVVVLSIFTILFSKTDAKKKSVGLAIIGVILVICLVIFGVTKLGRSASDWLYGQVLAPKQPQTESGVSLGSGHLTGDQSSALDNLSGGNIALSGSEDLLSGNEEKPDAGTEASPQESSSSESQNSRFEDIGTNERLSYAQIIPYLVEKYQLKKKGSKTYNFSSISSSNSLYPSFEIAASHAMIGATINPATQPSCDTYLVLKGIAQGREVNYTGAPQPAYRSKANSLNQVNGCSSGQRVTKSTL